MSRLCLVTNATARSICWYIVVYLKETKLSNERIKEIKDKLNFSDQNTINFSLDEFVKSFTSKNIYFLKLYSHLKENNRYLNMLETLQNQNRVSHYFPQLSDISAIYDNFQNRKVYHTSIFCKWMKNNYVDENRFALNTGVFADDFLYSKAAYYKIDESYLKELALRECNICKDIFLNSLGDPLTSFEIIPLIHKASESISITFDIIADSLVFFALIVKSKNIKVDIYVRESEWESADINALINHNFVVRLVHNSFSFFNSESMLLLDNQLYFHSHSYYYIPNKDNVDTTAFHYLKYNTIAISNIIEDNSSYAYYVPVKRIHSSHDDVFGEQSIVELESFGLTGFLQLKCHFSKVPSTIFGFWQSKAEVISSKINNKDLNHSYFDFECLDPNVLEFL